MTAVHSTDVAVVGFGVAGLAAARAALERGCRVVLVDQERRAGIGGQARWSGGGLFLVDTPEQRALGICDSAELAWSDWQCAAEFTRNEDRARVWAERYVTVAATELRGRLASWGVSLAPQVSRPKARERGGPGNSVARFHTIAGGGRALVAAMAAGLREWEKDGRLTVLDSHRVTELVRAGGRTVGVRGSVRKDNPGSADDAVAPARRSADEDFEVRANAVVVASGGFAANLRTVRDRWPSQWPAPPASLLVGTPAHVDGSMQALVIDAGGAMGNTDHCAHYYEGVEHPDPRWPAHGVRVMGGDPSWWLDHRGAPLAGRVAGPLSGATAIPQVISEGAAHSWLVTPRSAALASLRLSGLGARAASPVQLTRRDGALLRFLDACPDVVQADEPADLVSKMNDLAPGQEVERELLTGAVRQMSGLPHVVAQPCGWVALRLRVLTRKTLGGIVTDIDGAVITADDQVMPGLFAVGEASGFGGGGMHGRLPLEGAFLGGCLVSGAIAGAAAAG